jgi:hypothetical protein
MDEKADTQATDADNQAIQGTPASTLNKKTPVPAIPAPSPDSTLNPTTTPSLT